MRALQPFRADTAPPEARQDHRYVTPALLLEIEGRAHRSVNWSLGGFLVQGDLRLELGAAVSGTLQMKGSDGFDFVARLVRRDAGRQALAFRFEELTPLALSRLNIAQAIRSGRAQ
jgi:hypothetical protein